MAVDSHDCPFSSDSRRQAVRPLIAPSSITDVDGLFGMQASPDLSAELRSVDR